VRQAAESLAARTARAQAIVRRLEAAYPDWGCTLRFKSPFELLVATILAAQTTDENVNRVTEGLFRKYSKPQDYLDVPLEELERDLFKTGFYRAKARAVRAASKGLLAQFGGEVPRDVERLTRLHGVGRKTASIVVGAAYGVPALGVDTHVARVAGRLRLTTEERDRDRMEAEICSLFAPEEWIKVNWCLIFHGRRCCVARKPLCPRCPVLDLCPFPAKSID